jgi:hypothetical protein
VVIYQACRVGARLGLRGGDPCRAGDAAVSSRDSAQPLGVGILAGHGSSAGLGLGWPGLRGREPSGAEQRLCRPMGQGLGTPAVLLLYCGMEEPSTI